MKKTLQEIIKANCMCENDTVTIGDDREYSLHMVRACMDHDKPFKKIVFASNGVHQIEATFGIDFKINIDEKEKPSSDKIKARMQRSLNQFFGYFDSAPHIRELMSAQKNKRDALAERERVTDEALKPRRSQRPEPTKATPKAVSDTRNQLKEAMGFLMFGNAPKAVPEKPTEAPPMPKQAASYSKDLIDEIARGLHSANSRSKLRRSLAINEMLTTVDLSDASIDSDDVSEVMKRTIEVLYDAGYRKV